MILASLEGTSRAGDATTRDHLKGRASDAGRAVFAQTKVVRGIKRFQRRGLAACRAEWRLIAATHNLLKFWRNSVGPATA